eukprot:1371778-Amorphochlora_amoeboformis.AAC.1
MLEISRDPEDFWRSSHPVVPGTNRLPDIALVHGNNGVSDYQFTRRDITPCQAPRRILEYSPRT